MVSDINVITYDLRYIPMKLKPLEIYNIDNQYFSVPMIKTPITCGISCKRACTLKFVWLLNDEIWRQFGSHQPDINVLS